MKVLYILFLLMAVASTDLMACNTCGCGVANYHYGIIPQFQKHFVGLRYRYRSFDSRLDATHLSTFSKETFQSMEMWSRFYPSDRLQLFAFVPYNFNMRREGELTTYLQGLGDIVIAANYNLLNTYDSISNWKHSLLLGGGVKLPTGNFDAMQNGLTINQNFQLGTGSVDLLMNMIYTLRYKNAGINAEFTYNYNTTNQDEYRFGNTTRSGLTAFVVRKSSAFTWMPNVGVSVETFEDNRQYDQVFPDSGGWAMLFNAGVETYYKRFAVGLSYSHAGKQQLFNEQVTANDRLSMHATFMF